MKIDVFWYERVCTDRIDGIPYRILCVVESLQPMVEVDAAKPDGIDNILMDATFEHQFLHLLSVHVACTAVGVGNDHDFLYTQFVDGYKETTHGRVERTDNQSTGVLDELGISVLQAQSCWQKLSEAGVHTGKNGKFLVRIFTRKILFVSLTGYEVFIILDPLAELI